MHCLYVCKGNSLEQPRHITPVSGPLLQSSLRPRNEVYEYETHQSTSQCHNHHQHILLEI